MTDPKLVITGFDGSPESRAAARWAAKWCVLTGSPLRLLAVAGTVGSAQRELTEGRFTTVEQQKNEITGALAEALAELTAEWPELSVDTKLVIGLPADQLIQASRAGALVVVGTRGLGGAMAALLGGVTEEVVTYAPGPVVVVPTGIGEPSPEAPIMLGIDAQAPSMPAAEFAFAAAQVSEVALVAASAMGNNGEDEEMQMLQEALAPLAEAHPDVVVDYQVLPGRARDVLPRAATVARLLVVGSRGRGGFAGLLLGSTSRRVVRTSVVPSVVVKDVERP